MHHLAATVVALAVLVGSAGSASANEADDPGVRARFEGRTIDLSESWEEAAACAEVDGYVECFRSEEAMDDYLESTTAMSDAAQANAMAACSSSLRLYDGTSFTGTVLSLSTQNLWLNLSGYGFDNRTSSYRVGACGVYMAENSGGGGAWYPGNTGAGASAATMVTGWNNRVSSVYIQ